MIDVVEKLADLTFKSSTVALSALIPVIVAIMLTGVIMMFSGLLTKSGDEIHEKNKIPMKIIHMIMASIATVVVVVLFSKLRVLHIKYGFL